MRSLVNKVNSQKVLAKYAYCLMNACPLKTCSRNEMRPVSFLLYLMVNMFLSLIQQSAHSVVAPRASIKTVRADEHVLSGRVIYSAAGRCSASADHRTADVYPS